MQIHSTQLEKRHKTLALKKGGEPDSMYTKKQKTETRSGRQTMLQIAELQYNWLLSIILLLPPGAKDGKFREPARQLVSQSCMIRRNVIEGEEKDQEEKEEEEGEEVFFLSVSAAS